MTVRRLTEADRERELSALANVLWDCVEGGASVSFMAPFSLSAAEQFFTTVFAEVAAGRRHLLAAFLNAQLVGTLQILTATPPNQAHRADFAKLLVHRSARGSGVGQRLMEHAETLALQLGRTLLVLDTVPDSPADRLYTRLGWTKAGIIPDYAHFPDGRLCDTAIFWKKLR